MSSIVKYISNVILIILAILLVVEIFANLMSVRNNRCKKEDVKKRLNTSRLLIIVALIIYSLYGIVRNIL